MEVKLYSRPNKDGKKVLYVDYTEKMGKRVRRSLNLLENKANIAYVHRNIIPKIERKLKYGLRFEGYKLSEFTDKVLEEAKEKKINTYYTYECAIKKFYSIMGDLEIDEVSIRDIEKYIGTLKKQGMSSATINVYLAPIAMAFKDAIRLDVIDKNPVTFAKKPTVKNKEKKVFNLMQMHNLLKNAKGELKTFLYFAFFTGARPGEIIAMRWEDITDDTISINRTMVKHKGENLPKGGKKRKIALLKPLKEYLSNIRQKNGKVLKQTYVTFVNQFTMLLEKVGYDRRTPHAIRHTFASLLMKAKEDPTLIQYFLGHSSLDMIHKVYAHYIEDDKDVGRVEELLALS